MPAVRDRSISWRSLAASAAIGVAIGGALLWFRREAVALAPPPTCAGVFEGIGAWIARLTPSRPIGGWILWTHGAALIVALGAFAALAAATTARWTIAIAGTAAVASLPIFLPVFAPFAPGTFAAAAVLWLTLLAPPGPADDGRRRSLRWAAWMATVLIEPRLTWPLAIAAAWHERIADATPEGRGADRPGARWQRPAALAAALAIGSGLAQFAVIPHLPTVAGPELHCVVARPAGITDVLDSVKWLLLAAGGFPAVLAMLGAFSIRATLRERRTWPLAALAVAPVLVATWPDPDAAAVLAPSVVAFWVLVVLGTTALTRACGAGAGGRIAAAALVLLLPGLQSVQPARRLPESLIPFGQESLSLTDLRRALDRLPDRSLLVAEDAITDLLLRGASGKSLERGTQVLVAPRGARDLAERLRGSDAPVFALPGAQADLQLAGLRLSDAAIGGLAGLARVASGGACRPIGPAWRLVSDLTSASAFAVAAREDRARPPIVVYVAGDRPLTPRAHEWPGATKRGFLWDAYDLGQDPEKGRLASAESADQLRAEWLGDHRYVLRFVLQWMPDAPGALAVDLGNVPGSAVARIDSNPARQQVLICPAFLYERGRFAVTP